MPNAQERDDTRDDKQDARRDDAPATADTPQLVQTGVAQAGSGTALLATTAIAAHAIASRKRK